MAIQRNGVRLEFAKLSKVHQNLHLNDVFYFFNELHYAKRY